MSSLGASSGFFLKNVAERTLQYCPLTLMIGYAAGQFDCSTE